MSGGFSPGGSVRPGLVQTDALLQGAEVLLETACPAIGSAGLQREVSQTPVSGPSLGDFCKCGADAVSLHVLGGHQLTNIGIVAPGSAALLHGDHAQHPAIGLRPLDTVRKSVQCQRRDLIW